MAERPDRAGGVGTPSQRGKRRTRRRPPRRLGVRCFARIGGLFLGPHHIHPGRCFQPFRQPSLPRKGTRFLTRGIALPSHAMQFPFTLCVDGGPGATDQRAGHGGLTHERRGETQGDGTPQQHHRAVTIKVRRRSSDASRTPAARRRVAGRTPGKRHVADPRQQIRRPRSAGGSAGWTP